MDQNKKIGFLVATLAIALVVMVGMNVYLLSGKEDSQAKGDIFGENVRAYLLENPKVIREAIEVLSAQEAAEAEERKRAALKDNLSELENDGYSFVAGNPDGDITIVEFFDYRCGYCKRSFPDLMKTVADDGNIRLVMKEFPILGDQSVLASRAVMASVNQGKYNEFHAVMMQSRGSLTLDRIMKYAESVGLDTLQLAKDMKSEKITESIQRTYALAQALDINGTPAFVIGGELAPGAIPAEVMKKMVAEARERNTKTATN